MTLDDNGNEHNASILRGLMKNIPGMVYRGNVDWSINIMRGCEELCGYTADEVSAMDGAWLAVVHPDERESVAMEGGKIIEKPSSIVQVYRIVTRSGEERWVEDRKTSFFENGEFAGVDGILFDITERREREEAYAKAKEDLIRQQGRSIRELSTPVLQMWDEVLVLPLIGTVDTQRAQQLIEMLLEAIVRVQATVAILDVTGVPVVDTLVANHLLKTIEAARMLGAEVIVTGVNPENAQTLVKLGVDLGRVNAQSSLQSGLRMAFEKTDHVIVKTAS